MAFIKTDGSSMGLPMNIQRGNPIPLDTTSVWYSLAEAKIYAETSSTAYVGQIITVVDQTNNTSTAYIISNASGKLESLGTTSESGGLKGKLTIGNITYDGTSDVSVEVYDGSTQ